MADERRGWQPDPFGVHEFRFFSDDGRATLLVRDGAVNSYDKPPADAEFVETRAQAEVPAAREFVQIQAPVPTDGAFVQTRVPTDARFVQAPDGPIPTAAPVSEPKTPLAAPDVIRPLRPADLDSRVRMQALLRPPDPIRRPMPMISKSAKVVYLAVLTAMAVSGVALVAIHLGGHGHPPAEAATTTTTKPATPTTGGPTTTVVLPAALQPSAAVAASRFIASWAAGNEAQASTVATASAVSTLFAGHYTAGLVIDRGCSVAFSIVCTYGPPGGANPTDPVYQIHVVQAPAGWYVASVTIDN